jgi:integral membrane sensor domain MASE1
MTVQSRKASHGIARTVGSGLIILAIYFLAGKFGLSVAFFNASASPIWPPTGIALAVLLLYGYRCWWFIFAGAFLVNVTTQGSIATSLPLPEAIPWRL